MGYGQQQQQTQQAQQRAGGGQIDPQLYQYLQSVEHRLGGIQQMNQAAQEQQTQAVLNEFAKDKPHFERVRRGMGELLQPDAQGRSIIPLTPEGHVNLLEAYNMAVRTDEELNNQMFAERAAAERKAAADAAAKARRAGVSFAPSSPGRNTGSSANKQQRGKSVRESLQAAVEQARGSAKY
jgi:hypothetical protein